MDARFRRLLLRCSLACLALGGGTAEPVSAADDPEVRWLHAFVLTQTGSQLAEQDLWPLALANYSAALAQFSQLAAAHPDFQPRLVRYRLEDLKQRIARANASMNAGEHDLAMHYEDIIETAREGATRRYGLDFAGSYPFLVRAQWQLEELLRQCPPIAVAALEKQRAFIDSLTDETREDLIREPGGILQLHRIEKDFAASVSVAMSDLPSFRPTGLEETETGMSSALFPDELVRQVRSQWY